MDEYVFDYLYNAGHGYYTVLGIRFSDFGLAGAYAQARADMCGSPVHLFKYESANPRGFLLQTYQTRA